MYIRTGAAIKPLAVSYTHLDVYKRQAIPFPTLRRPDTIANVPALFSQEIIERQPDADHSDQTSIPLTDIKTGISRYSPLRDISKIHILVNLLQPLPISACLQKTVQTCLLYTSNMGIKLVKMTLAARASSKLEMMPLVKVAEIIRNNSQGILFFQVSNTLVFI